MNELSLHKFAASVASGGLILYNSTKLPEGFAAPQARVICVPASEIADGLGTAKVANVVMLGALLEETECLPTESAISVLEQTVKNAKLLEPLVHWAVPNLPDHEVASMSVVMIEAVQSNLLLILHSPKRARQAKLRVVEKFIVAAVRGMQLQGKDA